MLRDLITHIYGCLSSPGAAEICDIVGGGQWISETQRGREGGRKGRKEGESKCKTEKREFFSLGKAIQDIKQTNKMYKVDCQQ